MAGWLDENRVCDYETCSRKADFVCNEYYVDLWWAGYDLCQNHYLIVKREIEECGNHLKVRKLDSPQSS